MFKHEDNQIDPRDKYLVSYHKDSKTFVCEASDLRANGIEPVSHYFTIDGPKWVIYMWSETYQTSICYKQTSQIKNEGDVIADVFVPYFSVLTGGNDSKAHAASRGTELHILND
jgi:hypothetical protein